MSYGSVFPSAKDGRSWLATVLPGVLFVKIGYFICEFDGFLDDS